MLLKIVTVLELKTKTISFSIFYIGRLQFGYKNSYKIIYNVLNLHYKWKAPQPSATTSM